jgi:hypothetical protein
VAPKANIEVSIVSSPSNAAASKELLDQLESLRKKAVDIGKVIREQLSSAWASARDSSNSAVKTMNEGLGSLQKIGEAQEKIASKAKERADSQVKFLSGMGELASKTAEVAKNIVLVGTNSEEASKAVEKAFGKIENAFKAFSGGLEVFNKAKEQLEMLKQLRNVESPAKDLGPIATKAVSMTKSGLGWTASKAKSGFAAAATKGDELLGDISPGLQKATEQAASKLKAAVGAMGTKLKAAASEMGDKFGSLGQSVSGALGKVGAWFGELTTLAGGLVAVIGAAVASIVVSLDKMFNNGMMVRSIKMRWNHFFGNDLSTGDTTEVEKETHKKIDENLDKLHFQKATHKELREGQREYFASQGRAGDYDKYELGQAKLDVSQAKSEYAEFKDKGSIDQARIPELKEKNLAAYDRVKEAQERILQSTRETTRELDAQLASQRQQVAAAEKLVEQEKARFQGRKAQFAQLPEDVRHRLSDIGRKIGSGKDLTDTEADYAHKYDYFNAAVTKHYAAKINPDEEAALKAGGESGVETAVNAVNEARANEAKIQKAVEASVREERVQTEAIYKTRQQIAELKWDYRFGTIGVPKLNTELPNLGPSSSSVSPDSSGQAVNHAPSSPTASQRQAQSDSASHTTTAGVPQAAVDFEKAFDALLKNELVPAILETVRRAVAKLNNAA